MKNLVLFFSLMLMSYSAMAQSKVGTIDADYILSQMPEMAEVDAGLKTYNTDLQTELQNTITKYETLVEAYQEENATYNEEEKKTKESEIMSLENDIKGFRQKASVMMQMKRNELTDPLYERINEAMLEVITEGGYTQVLHAGGNAIAFAAEEFDITDEVIQKLGLTVQQ